MSTKITHYSCLCRPHQDQDQVCFWSQNWLPKRTEAEGDETTREASHDSNMVTCCCNSINDQKNDKNKKKFYQILCKIPPCGYLAKNKSVEASD